MHQRTSDAEALTTWLLTSDKAKGPRGDRVREILSHMRNGQELSSQDEDMIRAAKGDLAVAAI
jgi:hypothetical protein